MNNRNELLENYESMRIGTDKTLLIRGHGFILCLFCIVKLLLYRILSLL